MLSSTGRSIPDRASTRMETAAESRPRARSTSTRRAVRHLALLLRPRDGTLKGVFQFPQAGAHERTQFFIERGDFDGGIDQKASPAIRHRGGDQPLEELMQPAEGIGGAVQTGDPPPGRPVQIVLERPREQCPLVAEGIVEAAPPIRIRSDSPRTEVAPYPSCQKQATAASITAASSKARCRPMALLQT